METYTTQIPSYFSTVTKQIKMKHNPFSFPDTKLYNRENPIKIRSVVFTWYSYQAIRYERQTNIRTKAQKVSFFDSIPYKLFLRDSFFYHVLFYLFVLSYVRTQFFYRFIICMQYRDITLVILYYVYR